MKSKLKLVAEANCNGLDAEHSKQIQHENFFRSADWSPDGTCVITNSTDNCIRTFIISPDLLDLRDEALRLEPYSVIESPEAADALAHYPNYELADPSTTLILSAVNEHPIRLNSAITSDLVAVYPLINPSTEAYIKPKSLIFVSGGSHFVAGSENLISTFDLSRPGNEPLSSLKTGPKRSKSPWSNPALSLRGPISALAIDKQFGVLAAGTLSRCVGLYDSSGQGECIGTFSIAGTTAEDTISGNGVTQMVWSQCGRYLYITERKSDGTLIYDIRKTGQLLAWTIGRAAKTNQRMKVELSCYPDIDDGSLWAGGQDGMLRYWNAPHIHHGMVEPKEASKVHTDLVNSVSLHPNASDVLVTAAGQRSSKSDFLSRISTNVAAHKDNSLRIWQRAAVDANDNVCPHSDDRRATVID